MDVMAVVSDKEIESTPVTVGETLSAEDRLAVAMEALGAIVAENDLTCMRALFRMRRRAEVALARIEAAAGHDIRH
ncbi:hypothetical protein NY78_2522 [Desulfovibrio sp. TomC]|nr:hypothetical protein NY78_2522 [Desulfovibrio sp. TomC]